MNEGVYNGTTVGGVWRRGQGVFHAKVAHQGSSWAPMFSAYFHDTEGYDGFYTFGHLSSAGASVGTYCLQFMDGAGNANKAWSFNGSNGDFTSPGNVVAYSDIRVKTKIEKIENALDKIDQITGVTYDRTDVVTSRQMGVIAQDVEKVAPEVVTRTQHGELGEILGVSYGNLVGLLIEGIKELRGELAELKTQMNK
ncbi:MAG: tail fiber domain-containing protein [Shewanella sp.]